MDYFADEIGLEGTTDEEDLVIHLENFAMEEECILYGLIVDEPLDAVIANVTTNKIISINDVILSEQGEQFRVCRKVTSPLRESNKYESAVVPVMEEMLALRKAKIIDISPRLTIYYVEEV